MFIVWITSTQKIEDEMPLSMPGFVDAAGIKFWFIYLFIRVDYLFIPSLNFRVAYFDIGNYIIDDRSQILNSDSIH